MMRLLLSLAVVLAITAPAVSQDVRGLELCTAEKAMERRTSCLQSNVEFLQQALAKLRRDVQDQLAAGSREATAQKAEIAALKMALTNLQNELADLKNPKPDKK